MKHISTILAPSSAGRERPTYSAPALGKGLDILELLARRRQSLSLRTVAGELGRSKGEIFRIMMVLLERGYIARGDGDSYALTGRLFELGLRTPAVRDLLEEALPAMRRLAAEAGHSPHLVVLDGGHTAVIATATGESDISFTLRLGFRRPAVDATSGQVIIAFQDAATQRRLIEEGLPFVDPNFDRDALHADLSRIRAQGYELRPSRDFVGITDICCPVLGIDGTAVASIIISHIDRLNRESRHRQVLVALRSTCDGIGIKACAL